MFEVRYEVWGREGGGGGGVEGREKRGGGGGGGGGEREKRDGVCFTSYTKEQVEMVPPA